MTQKALCLSCGGIGHLPNCSCTGPVSFIVGCCPKCGGEGFITVKPEARIVIARG